MSENITTTDDEESQLNVVGLVGLIVFYLLIFFAGIFSHKLVQGGPNSKINIKWSLEEMVGAEVYLP